MAGVLHRRIYLPAVTSGCTDLHSSHFSHSSFAQLERRDAELLAAVNSGALRPTVEVGLDFLRFRFHPLQGGNLNNWRLHPD